jgi:hypothetical protein
VMRVLNSGSACEWGQMSLVPVKIVKSARRL